MRFRKKNQKLIYALLGLLITAVFCGIAVLETDAADTEIQAETISIHNFNSTPQSEGFLLSQFKKLSQKPQGILSVPAGQNSYTFYSAEYNLDFTANAVGVKWTGQLQSEDDVQIVANVKNNHDRINRVLPHLNGDLKEPLPVGTYSTNPIILEEPSEISLTVTLNRSTDGTSPTINNLEIIYFDTTQEISFRGLAQQAMAGGADDEPEIVSRAQWGADEALRMDSEGDPIWPTEYQDPTVFILHHTAGTDGGDDPAATIRAIYYWHAVVLGWGDIGYNYIIDPNGTIYKGRVGKDGVVGGHTFNDIEGINYNEGSVGIAFLGCFEETPGACYSQHEVTAAMEDSLAQLVAIKSADFGFGPKTKVAFHGTTAKRLSGHNELDSTFCPGSELYDQLGSIRNSAKSLYKNLTTEPWEAALASFTLVDAELDDLTLQEKNTATVSYINTGTETWERDKLRLKLYNKTGKKKSPLADDSWGDIFGKVQMNEETVATGETATFTLIVDTPRSPGTKTLTTKLFYQKTKVKSSSEKHEMQYTSTAAGELVKYNFPIAMYSGDQNKVWFNYKNTGSEPWGNDVVVVINNEEQTQFREIVEPGESSKAKFTYTAPEVDTSAGPIVKKIVVQLKKDAWVIPGTRQALLMEVH